MNNWEKHDLHYQHPDGRQTAMYVQTDGRHYVLSEHPLNTGPHVSTVATTMGDGLIRKELITNPQSLPEHLLLYAERRDRGEDGNFRFDQWEAKTTRLENTSQEPNRFDHKPAEWLWKNARQFEHGDLENKLGVRLEQAPQRFQDLPAQEQNRQFAEASLPKTEQSEQLRQAAQHKR